MRYLVKTIAQNSDTYRVIASGNDIEPLSCMAESYFIKNNVQTVKITDMKKGCVAKDSTSKDCIWERR